MSEEVKDNKDSETRVKINTKDAAAAMLPAGVDVEKLTPEQQLNVTSTMVKASRLHEKAIEGLTLEEQDVFNALLLATPDDMEVEKLWREDGINQMGLDDDPYEITKPENLLNSL